MKTFLDTNALILFHRGNLKDISEKALAAFDEAETLAISPMVLLELKFLEEIGRLKYSGEEIMDYFHTVHGVEVDETDFSLILRKAAGCSWTRDPFDRIITAQAAVSDSILLTKDRTIQLHYPKALW